MTRRPVDHIVSRRAFTLIELLVVVGIIAVAATLIGIGLTRGGEATALRAGQSLLVSQLNSARAHAALSEDVAVLAIPLDATDPDRDHRLLSVAIDDDGLWRAVSDGTYLPEPIRIVGPEFGSSLLATTAPVALDPGNQTTLCYIIEFRPNGSLLNRGGGQVSLAVSQRTASGWEFLPDTPTQRVAVSRYGAISTQEEVVVTP
ncbi:MAG: hypothetical protein SynsKO_26090 [Synoicihabitans sp.]